MKALITVAQEKPLRVVNEFPSESQVNSFNYVLGRGTRFDTDQSAIYYCSQSQHVVFKLDYEGNLIKRIGRNGQGPGEFQHPLIHCLIGDQLAVSDNGNSKIQILTLDGSYIKQLLMLEGIYSLVTIKNQLYLQILEQYGKKRNGPAIFASYSLNGELLSFFGEIGKSEYNTFYNDNSQTIRAFKGELHCLQLYGTTYRIYNPMGEPVREIKLEVNPLHNKEHKKTGWLYTYRSFAVDEHRIYGLFHEKLAAYPRARQAIQIAMPDLQGPLDTTDQLWGCGLFAAFYEEPELVDKLLGRLVDVILHVADKFRAFATDRLDPFANAQHAWQVPGRLLIRSDSAIMLSPQMYAEQVRPHDQRLLLAVGGVITWAVIQAPPNLLALSSQAAPSSPWSRGFDIVAGSQVSWILMVADFSRYTRSEKTAGMAVFLGLLLTSLWRSPERWTVPG